MLFDPAKLKEIMPAATNVAIKTYIDSLNKQMEAAAINTFLRMSHFLAQIGHETGDMRAVEENLNYSAEALIRSWPSLFNQGNAEQYAHQPEKIANRAYGNRYGNGPEESADGWRYHGRGMMQTTFKGNYLAFEKATGIQVVENPDLIAIDPDICVATATYFWTSHNLNTLADADDVLGITKKINGGTNGYDDRCLRLERAKLALRVPSVP